jgi:hypothetical protein
MAVHMFIFYWGMLSSITPPVAIASFAAAGIAGAPAMKTGWESMWVGSDHLLPAVLLRVEPGAGAAGRPMSKAWLMAWPCWASCSSAAASRATRPSSATCAAPVARMADPRAADGGRRHAAGDAWWRRHLAHRWTGI